MVNEQILVGALLSLLCLLGIWQAGWILTNTRKGQWLVRRFGRTGAKRFWLALMTVGALLGGLLATNVLHPIQW